MKEITLKLYKIDELSDKARARAIEDARYINVEPDEWWNDDIKEEYIAELNHKGYEDVEILYSGFNNQGDGACFTAKVDLETWLETHKEVAAPNVRKNVDMVHFSIEHNYHHYFSTSTDVEYRYDYADGVDSDLLAKEAGEEILPVIEKEREVIGDQLYKELETRFYDLLSDESVLDTLQQNDYHFTEKGEVYYIA